MRGKNGFQRKLGGRDGYIDKKPLEVIILILPRHHYNTLEIESI